MHQLVLSNPRKAVGELHPTHQLEKMERMRAKAELVSRQRKAGRLPQLLTIRDRLSRLHDADYCLSEAHQADLWRGAADQGDLALVGFAHAFVKKGAQLGIPLVAERFTVTTVEVVHAQWRYCLPADDWAILAYLGRGVVAGLSPRLDVRWLPETASVEASVSDVDQLIATFDPAKWVLRV